MAEPAAAAAAAAGLATAAGRKKLLGTVTSTKMMKTVTVAVTRLFRHPRYDKYVRSTKKYLAHDEGEECRVGDAVKLAETRPLSKRKRWVVSEIVRRAPDMDLASAAARAEPRGFAAGGAE